MKAALLWLNKYSGLICGIPSIVMGVYFGVFYVPSWLRDSQVEKSINAQLSLQQSIKELIYSDSICKPSEVVALIEGKEIDLGQPYPYIRKQLLTQVQTSFMQPEVEFTHLGLQRFQTAALS